MISSSSNKKIKDVGLLLKKSSYRKERGLFVVEGIKMFEEIPDDFIEEIYVSESFFSSCDKGVRSKITSHNYETVTDTVYEHISDTSTPQGILALVRMIHYDLDSLLRKDNPSFVILDKLQDPGNLGTILRSSEGAGIDAVIMSRDTVDIYSPKVIRSTMGSVFRLPHLYTDNLTETIYIMKKSGVRMFAAHLSGINSYDKEDYTGPTAFLIGNESKGLSDEVTEAADIKVRIPMRGLVESLNASVAASVLIFEMARQRRNIG